VIEADFRERNYLWTGRLTTFAYGRDCVFTDPTLTFTGVDTFKRNLANLSPAIDALVENPTTRLFKIELKEEQDQIIAEWEMEGRIRLPWRPRIKLQGETRYTFSPSLRNKIVRYDESWGITAGEALKQILTPVTAQQSW